MKPRRAAENRLRLFLAALEKETLAFGKPVVYVHGDTHISASTSARRLREQRIIENFTESRHSATRHHWIRATIDPAIRSVRFRQEIVKANRVVH